MIVVHPKMEQQLSYSFNTCHHVLELDRWRVVQRLVRAFTIELVDEDADA